MSKGAISLFFKWSDLGSNVHVTDAKVDDVYNVCNQIKLAFNTKIASIFVDNAASKVAGRVAKKLNADGDPALALRDPAHYIDLLSKDLAKASVVRSVLAEAKEVFELCQTNQIDNICKEAINAGDIPDSIVAQNDVETRMNLTYIHLSSGRNASGNGFSPRKQFFLAKNVNIKSRIFSTEILEIFVKLFH